MARLQITLYPLILKLKLPQGQINNHGSDASYDRHIYRKTEKTNAKERQIECQHNTRKTNDGDKKGSVTLPILCVHAEQLFVDGLPFGNAFVFRGDGLCFHIFVCGVMTPNVES